MNWPVNNAKSHIVFLGIGGIGMSALARHYLRRGTPVFGYDKVETELTQALEEEGAIICYDERLDRYPGWSPEETTVIYTPALPQTLSWMRYFQPFGMIKRAEALGQIANSGRGLAVAGTHGKTSTSAILVHILTEVGLDPTAFIGGIMSNTGTNYRLGNSDLVVVEADEFDRSFLHLHPHASAITTTDADHLDIYSDPEDLLQTFAAFRDQNSGPTFTATGLEGTTEVGRPGSHAWATDIQPQHGAYSFTLHLGERSEPTKLHMPGRHNVSNAVLAASLAAHVGATLEDIARALPTFQGIKRRFEFHSFEPVVIIEDYAHHPTEIAALMDSINELYPEGKVALVFQPHLFTRTRDFIDGFQYQLSRADQCFILPIYPARELPIEGVTSEVLAGGISGAQSVQKEALIPALKAYAPDVILMVGAGDIGQWVAPVKTEFV